MERTRDHWASSAYTDDTRGDNGLSTWITHAVGQWRLLLALPVICGALGAAGSYLITPRFMATTTFLPPQQQQSAVASALASLGSLASLAGAGAVRTPADQYIALMYSVTVSTRIIDQFKLRDVYNEELYVEARKELLKNVQISAGKKDGLISVAVEDTSSQRAADMANQYVEELRRLTSTLAVTEAQQRRAFFEKHLQETRAKLTQSQLELQQSGFSVGALKAEPRSAAESFARLKAEATAAEVRLQTLRGTLSESTPEVRQQQALLGALRSQLAKAEQPSDTGGGTDYIGKYRDFKYNETLFELFARQYELARVDESREGALIQVVDRASPPEKKSKPRRSLVAAGGFAAGLLIAVLVVVLRRGSRRDASGAGPATGTQP